MTELEHSVIIAAIEAHDSGITIVDYNVPDMPLIFVNEGFCSFTGYSREEIIGKNCRFLQGPLTDQDTVQKIKKALEQGKKFCGELLNYRKDGTTFWNNLRLSLVNNSHGVISHFVGIQTDISDVKKIQIEKDDLLKNLQATKHSLLSFGKDIAHNVRTTIALVNSLSELAKEEIEDKVSKEVEGYLDDILRITNKAMDEINEKTVASLQI
ncbi:MAG: PAS domain-containing protein [Oligoflexales bacterium]